MCLVSVEDTYKHNHAFTRYTIYRHTCSHCRGQLHKTIMSLLDVPYVDTAQSWPASQSLDVHASLSVLAKAVSLHSGRTCRLLLVSYSPWTRQLVTVLATCTCRSVSPLHGHISMLSTVLKADRCRRVTYASGARSVHSNCFPCSPTLQHTLGTRWCHMARFNLGPHPGWKMVPHGSVVWAWQAEEVCFFIL